MGGEKFSAPVEVSVTAGGRPVPVGVTTGTQGARVVTPGPGPSRKASVVAKDDQAGPAAARTREDAEVQKLEVSADGSVPALLGHEPEMRRVEDGDGSPRWRVEDGVEPPAGFVVHVPPERGLEP